MATVSGDGRKAKVKLEDRSVLQVILARMAASPAAGALVGFVAVFLFFTLSTDTFLGSAAISGILANSAVLGIVAVGITFLMIAGEFDLSVGSILGVSGVIFGQVLIGEGVFEPFKDQVGTAFIIAILTGVILGLINGLILIWTRIPSFIVTLGTLLAYRALALTATSETGILRYVGDDPTITFAPWVLAVIAFALALLFGFLTVVFVRGRWSGLRQSVHRGDRIGHWFMLVLVTLILGLITLFFAFWLISLFLDISAVVDLDFNSSTILAVDFGNPIGSQDFSTPVTVSVFDMMNGSLDFFRDAGITGNFRSVSIWFFLVVVVFSFILRETTYSSAVYATGGNGEAARAQGIAVDRVRVINFVTCGALAAFAATLEFARQTSAAGDRGTGWELEAIAAAVIGGALLSGGYGTIIGTFIGVLLAGMLRTGLVQLGVPSAGFRGYIGVILVAAVILNNVVRTGQAPAWLLRVGQFLGGGGTSPPGSQSAGSAR